MVPNAFRERLTRVSAAWGDAACICPWEIYQAYGNKELLRRHFPMMKKWVDYQHAAGKEEFLWLDGHHYGDWLAMDAGDGVCEGATPKDLIASASVSYTHLDVYKRQDLEGARSGKPENLDSIRSIREATDLFMEVGGGIRSMETVERYFAAGVNRVILGTAAVTDAAFLKEALRRYGDRIAVGVDIKDGYVAIRGWTEQSAPVSYTHL